MRNYDTRGMEDKAGVNENESVVKLFVYRCIKIIVALMYLSMVFAINAVYVKLTVGAGDLMLVLLEVGIFIINSTCREFGIYYLVHYIFDKSNVLSSQASIVYSILLLTTDFLVPSMATLYTDDLCLGEYPYENRQQVTSSYSWTECHHYEPSTDECLEYIEKTAISTFTLPFIYSNHCRDALYRNYIPVIVLSCIWNTFLSPILYWRLTGSTRRLSEMFRVCGLEITTMRELVLPNLSIAMIYICEDFCLLLLYGIVSPYCAFAIGLGLLGRIFMTRGGILRYYKLQTSELADNTLKSEHEPKDEENQKQKENDINFMCKQARKNVLHVIWPGLLLSTYCFGFILFDMAYDNDEDSSTVSIGLLCSVVVVAHVTRLVYYYYKRKLEKEVMTRVVDLYSSSVSNNDVHYDDGTFEQFLEDGTLQSLKNPLLSGGIM